MAVGENCALARSLSSQPISFSLPVFGKAKSAHLRGPGRFLWHQDARFAIDYGVGNTAAPDPTAGTPNAAASTNAMPKLSCHGHRIAGSNREAITKTSAFRRRRHFPCPSTEPLKWTLSRSPSSSASASRDSLSRPRRRSHTDKEPLLLPRIFKARSTRSSLALHQPADGHETNSSSFLDRSSALKDSVIDSSDIGG